MLLIIQELRSKVKGQKPLYNQIVLDYYDDSVQVFELIVGVPQFALVT
jgi:hypothetical protein